MDKENEECLLSFGVVTDVQFADREDNKSWYCPDKIRYYRSSLDHVEKAFEKWRKQKVSFVLQLGDLLDASNRTLDLDCGEALRKTLAVFKKYSSIPSYHVLGNHEVDTFSRSQLSAYNFIGEGGRFYYSFSPADKISVVVLDCLEISILGYPSSHYNYKQAHHLLSQYHQTQDKLLWESDQHLQGSDKRFVSYNGAISHQQLDWLNKQLEIADEHKHKVILCGHLALFSESSSWNCVCWNWEEVLDVVHQHDCVVAYLCGHLHEPGYAVDSHGVHHVTMGGIIEVPPEDSAFSTVSMFKNEMKIKGFGREKSYVLPYPNPRFIS